MAVDTYTKTGNKAASIAKLDKSVFGVELKSHDLLKKAYVAYLANGRQNNAVTKKRGEVSGGGRKPWRQKGTGRARTGSNRNPVWRGGGIIFGPTGEENYTHKLPVSQKRQAIRQALSLAASENRVKVIENIDFKDGKVKPVLALLTKVGAGKNSLLVLEHKDEPVERSTKNLVGVKAVQAKYLNVYDLVNADTILVTQKGLDVIHEWLGGKK